MKRITSIILAAIICLTFTACQSTNQQNSSVANMASTAENSIPSANNSDFFTQETNSQYTPTPSVTEDIPSQPVITDQPSQITTPSDEEANDSYQDIKCATTTGYQEIRFLPQNSKANLVLKLPQEWKIQKSAEGFNIVKNSKIIGTVTDKFNSSGKIEHTAQNTLTFGMCDYSIKKIGDKQYNRVFNYTLDILGSKKTVALCVDYAELDADSFCELFYNSFLSWSTNKSNTGAMSFSDNRKKVAILGNSFIASSQIGGILQQMCGNKIAVEAQARGYAKVCTYADDIYLLNRIKSGEFSAVIIRGIYDRSDIKSFETLLDACNSTNTRLTVFPAHNENDIYINMLKEKFPNVLFLNWKDEINGLINGGIDRAEFCVDDSAEHSTPLAGYVGAHMIYRAIFGCVPTQKSFAEVSAQQINLLGSYANTGLVDSSVKDEYVVYRF